MARSKSQRTNLAQDAAQCVVTMAQLHGKPVQVFASQTKLLFVIDGGDEHTLTPDYVGTYGRDGAEEVQEDLMDHWRT